MTVFWDVATCNLLEVNSLCHRPDDGGSNKLRNVDKLLLEYTVQRPGRQPSVDHAVT